MSEVSIAVLEVLKLRSKLNTMIEQGRSLTDPMLLSTSQLLDEIMNKHGILTGGYKPKN